MEALQQILRVFLALTAFSEVALAGVDPFLRLTSDGPVVLDATITFKAELHNVDDYDPPFFFAWNDDASPGHWNEQETNSKVSHWNVSYASRFKYEERQYKMTVRVFYQGIFGRDKIAESSVVYMVTKNLNGHVTFSQSKVDKTGQLISTKEETELSVKFHDPSGFLANAAIQYFWFVNDTNYGPSENNSFKFTFAMPGKYTVETIVMAQIAGDDSAPAVMSLSSMTSLSSSELQKNAPPHMKTGVFRANLESRTPMSNFNFTNPDDLVVHSGKLMDVTMVCDGSGPWHACWKVMAEPYNATGNENCTNLSEFLLEDKCNFPIIWYFREKGPHDILTIVDNGISKRVLVLDAYSYVDPVIPSLTIVIVPVTCTLLGIFFLGIGSVMVYYVRINEAVETAEFDFNAPEEQLEYKSFWERLRDSMMNAFGNSSDDVSHVSSVSSRSIQHPITSIHYGSIS